MLQHVSSDAVFIVRVGATYVLDAAPVTDFAGWASGVFKARGP